MKRLYLIVLAVVLVGCYTSDPYAMQSVAEGWIVATERVAREQAKQATLAAAATNQASQAEIDLLTARMDATTTAWEIQQQQVQATAQAVADVSTQQALNLIQTQTAIPVQLTQTAIPGMIEAQKTKETIQQSLYLFWQILLLGVCVSLAVVGVLFARHFLNWFVEWRTMRHRLHETPSGQVIAYIWDEDHGLTPVMLGAGQSYRINRPALPASLEPVEQLTPSGSVLSSPLPTMQRIDARVLVLIDASARVYGMESNVIAGWRVAGVGGGTYDRAIKALRQFGLVEQLPDRKYILTGHGGYSTLGRLATDLRAGRLHLPYPSSTHLSEELWDSGDEQNE